MLACRSRDLVGMNYGKNEQFQCDGLCELQRLGLCGAFSERVASWPWTPDAGDAIDNSNHSQYLKIVSLRAIYSYKVRIQFRMS